MVSDIYILLSIKTRIETCLRWHRIGLASLFISYYPLKQGLKQNTKLSMAPGDTGFISYYPLKQGLKRDAITQINQAELEFISYYPLKQGLKHAIGRDIFPRAQHLYPTIH